MKRKKITYKVLYSNDTTHVGTCRLSPYRKPGDRFSEDMIRGSVDETADIGVDVHMIQPGVGWIPWWKSTVYPFSDHVKFVREKFGIESLDDGFGFSEYMAAGGDIVKVFIDSCHENNLAPFVSMRLNDGHGHDFVDTPPGEIAPWIWHCVCPAHLKYSQWRVGKDLTDWHQRGMDWTHKEIRDFKFDYIKEIIENYGIAGFELDFMRVFSFFKLEETSSQQRSNIMNNFIGLVRQCLNEKSKRTGDYLPLCVRIPGYLSCHDYMGIDVRKFYESGVDMFNLSYHYFTEQQGDYAQIKKMIPDASIYVEMAHTTYIDLTGIDCPGYDDFNFRSTTPNQYFTTAHLAYSRGVDGVSAFNFMYYRPFGSEGTGPMCEPPFEIFNHINDRAWLAQQPQHYILSNCWNDPPYRDWPLPFYFIPGNMAQFRLDMAPPTEGWKKDAKLRIMGMESLSDAVFNVRVNDRLVELTDDRSEPYPNSYKNALMNDDYYRAWVVPKEFLVDGVNKIDIKHRSGAHAAVGFLDLAIE